MGLLLLLAAVVALANASPVVPGKIPGPWTQFKASIETFTFNQGKNTSTPLMQVAVDAKQGLELAIGEVSGFANKQNITARFQVQLSSTIYRYPFFNTYVCYIFPFVNQALDSVTIPGLAHQWGVATLNGTVCNVWYAHPFSDGHKSQFYFVGPDNSLLLVSTLTNAEGTPFPKTLTDGDTFSYYYDMVPGVPTPAELNMSTDGCYDIAASGDSAGAYSALMGLLGRDKMAAQTPSSPRLVNDDAAISAINARATTWVAGHNPRFAGMTLAEARQLLGSNGLNPNRKESLPVVRRSTKTALPDAFDARVAWPNCPSIQAIRDQGQCGSCWAFGQSESLSDRFCIASNASINVVLSPQYILDCDVNDYGCGGGFVDAGWDATLANGIVSDACVPYAGANAPCDTTCADGSPIAKSMYKISAAYTPGSDAAAIQEEIMNFGPVEVAFEVYEDFFNYVSGVYQVTPGTAWAGGHGVKVLGWGVDNTVPYWLVANSWAATWGDSGFFKILRGSNECAFEMEVSTGTPIIPSL